MPTCSRITASIGGCRAKGLQTHPCTVRTRWMISREYLRHIHNRFGSAGGGRWGGRLTRASRLA
eukprot:363407-Chlamydomonas_euryale.AAC.4